MSDDDSFEPSKLGTKEHWDDVYARELANFEDDSGDEGEVWFGLDSVNKMVNWVKANVSPSSKPSILDIGCGNGTLSIALCEAGYNADGMLGIDYSPHSVKLAEAVANHRVGNGILKFATCDFLNEDPLGSSGIDTGVERWDLLLDKGTFDAIALAEKAEDGTVPSTKYPPRVVQLLKPGGYFLITSCNFTEDGLRKVFADAKIGLTYHSNVQYKSITFGGKSGSTYATVAFRKDDT